MNTLSASLAALLLGSTIFVANTGHACTEPEEGADEPSVSEGDDPNGEGFGEEPSDPSEGEPSGGEPSAEGGGGENILFGTPDEAANPTGGVATFVNPLIAWKPGSDVDADPNNRVFFRHGGHKVSTRVQVKDVASGAIVLDELVAQFDYEKATQESPGEIVTSFRAKLPAGAYEAKVQSVFYKHDEVRYGMEGRWQELREGAAMPAIGESVRGIAFKVREPARANEPGAAVSGGCSAIGGSAGALSGLAVLLAMGLRRRR